jgi:hypothetical protein
MRDEAKLRRRMGEAARQRIVEHYSLHTALPRLVDVIHGVVRQA